MWIEGSFGFLMQVNLAMKMRDQLVDLMYM